MASRKEKKTFTDSLGKPVDEMLREERLKASIAEDTIPNQQSQATEADLNPPSEPGQLPEEIQNAPQTFTSGDTGELSGLSIRGKFFALGARDIAAVKARSEAKGIPFEPLDAGRVAAAEEVFGQIGQPQEIGVREGADSIKGAVGKALAAGGVGALTGAGAGLATGPLAPIAAPAGAILGFLGAFTASLWKDTRQEVREADKDFTESRQALDDVIKSANMGMDPKEAVSLYNQQLAKIARARSELKLKTQGNLDDFLGQPDDELIKIEQFYETQIEQFNREMAEAIINPDPKRTGFFDDFSDTEGQNI